MWEAGAHYFISNLSAFELQIKKEKKKTFMPPCASLVKNKLASYLWWVMYIYLLKTTHCIVSATDLTSCMLIDLKQIRVYIVHYKSFKGKKCNFVHCWCGERPFCFGHMLNSGLRRPTLPILRVGITSWLFSLVFPSQGRKYRVKRFNIFLDTDLFLQAWLYVVGLLLFFCKGAPTSIWVFLQACFFFVLFFTKKF